MQFAFSTMLGCMRCCWCSCSAYFQIRARQVAPGLFISCVPAVAQRRLEAVCAACCQCVLVAGSWKWLVGLVVPGWVAHRRERRRLRPRLPGLKPLLLLVAPLRGLLLVRAGGSGGAPAPLRSPPLRAAHAAGCGAAVSQTCRSTRKCFKLHQVFRTLGC